MYADYWQLSCMPFENTPDPRFFYASSQHQEGLARLAYVVQSRKGAGVLTGVFGCGKTLIARSLLRELSPNRFRIIYIANPLMSEVELLHGIAYKLNIPDLVQKRSDILIDSLIESIEHSLKENARDGKDTLLLVDEAHVIRDEKVFEELRLLLNFQDEERFFLTLLLMGQPELKEMVDRNKPLSQRICVGYHLAALNAQESSDYVRHRLNVAGARNTSIFTEKALKVLYEFSGGIPRRINQLADMALMAGMGKEVKYIDEALIQEASSSIGV